MIRPASTAAAVLAAVCLTAAPPALAIEADDPIFATPCGYSHTASDDPIVAPGRPGASHSHDFVGNLSTNAFSTYDSLRSEGTACRREGDTAAYWTPSLTQNGRVLQPRRAQIYYQGGRRDRTQIRPHPANLRVIAGDAGATAPQSKSVVAWHCGSGSGVPGQTSPPDCPAGRDLRLRIRFPDCWNGRDLDSADHASHMDYSRRGACPATHAVAVPSIALNVHYPTTGGPGIELASGPHHTAHADFLNSWDQAELERLVATCINQTGNADKRPCKPRGAPVPSIEAGARVVPFRRTLVFAGSTGGAAGQPVAIEVQRRGVWRRVTEVMTGRRGVFLARVRVARNGRYRAVALTTGRPSRALRVLARPRIALRARRARAGRGVSVAARSTPMKARLVVRLERRVDGRYRLVRRAVLRARRGRVDSELRFRRRGVYRIVARTLADSSHDAGRSRSAFVRVR